MKRNTSIALVYWLIMAAIVFSAGQLRTIKTAFAVLGLAYVLLSWCPLLIVKFVERRPMASLGLQFSSPLQVILWGLVAFVLSTLLLMGEIGYRIHFRGEDLLLATPIVSNWLLEILQQFLWIGFPEEIVHRGYLLTRLKESWGSTPALFVSAALFGVGHLALEDLPTAIQAGLAGLIFGWVFLKTKSVYTSSLAHILGNLFGGTVVRIILSRYLLH
jgi:membrane protease YdiL (CAAX protease family)